MNGTVERKTWHGHSDSFGQKALVCGHIAIAAGRLGIGSRGCVIQRRPPKALIGNVIIGNVITVVFSLGVPVRDSRVLTSPAREISSLVTVG